MSGSSETIAVNASVVLATDVRCASRREARVGMLSAYVLIQTEVARAGWVAEAVGNLDGVQQAHEIAGPYDVIARIQAPDLDALARLVISRVQAVGGVTRTLICTVLREEPQDAPRPGQA